MSRRGVRTLEAAKFDDYQDTVKRICRDVTSLKDAVSKMDEKYVAMFSGIEKKTRRYYAVLVQAGIVTYTHIISCV
jgi:hypothetical protein